MRLARIIFIIGLACVTGCTTGRLRQRTINQGSTLPELQYQQVLDNLARFATNPALPAMARQPEGGNNAGHRLALRRRGGGHSALRSPGSRSSSARGPPWPSGGCRPVIDATELRLLRIAYRRAHGAPDMPSPDSSTSWPRN